MAPSTSQAQYAQKRRDNEETARNALKTLIPDEYIDEVEELGDCNPSTKVMKAAEQYITAFNEEKLLAEQKALEAENEGESLRNKRKRTELVEGIEVEEEDLSRPIPARREDRTESEERRHRAINAAHAPLTAIASPAVSALPEIQQLRQCTKRLLAIAEGKAEAALTPGGADGARTGSGYAGVAPGLSEELRRTIENGSDMMIDLIKVIEEQ